MSDMSEVIVPKSDQINADDLISGPMNITITDVQISGGKEQPVSMFFNGSEKAYRPCKSMCRVMVTAWGADASKYVGRSLTLYCDKKVKWGGMEVGGIRISHMSHIDAPMTMALTATRANKKPFTVTPMVKAEAELQPSNSRAIQPTDRERIEAALFDASMTTAAFLKATSKKSLDDVRDVDAAIEWIANHAVKEAI
jgi:hypothetical protein